MTRARGSIPQSGTETTTAATRPAPGWRERLAVRILEGLAATSPDRDPVRAMVRSILEETGLRFAAVRLRDGEGFPVYVSQAIGESLNPSASPSPPSTASAVAGSGSPPVSCLCQTVLGVGPTDRPPLLTPGGSLFASSLQDLVAAYGAATIDRFREHCAQTPFETVALIPLREGDDTVGLLVLAAPWPDALDVDDIVFLERLALSIAPVRAGQRLQQALLASQTRTRSLLEALPDLMFRLSRDGVHLEYFAPREDQLLVRPEEFLGRPVQAVLPARPAELYLRHIQAALDGGGKQTFEYWLDFSPQDRRYYEARLVPAGRNEVLAIVREITEAKRAEEALREIDRRRMEFLAVLSHELRNPLAPIRLSLDVLEHTPHESEQSTRAREIIDRQVDHLTRLVNDLLDVTRISRGMIELRKARLDCVDLVRRTCEDYRSTFAGAGLSFVEDLASGPLWIVGDAARIAQVLGNLLGNAAKFTPAGGEVSVSLRREGQVVVLQVRDSGAGIEAEVLARLFEPFVQARQALNRSHGGLGLGLALAKGIVVLHGGTIDAVSAGAGRGAQFTVRLPLQSSSVRSPASHAAPPSRTRTVLVIEDNIDAAESLKVGLELLGHRVRVAYDGPAGIAEALDSQPEVVLCDIGLPGMDGYAVARTFQADPRLRRCALIALSGYCLPEDRERGRKAGFLHHLAKPVELKVLQRYVLEARTRTH